MIIYFLLISLASVYCYITSHPLVEGLVSESNPENEPEPEPSWKEKIQECDNLEDGSFEKEQCRGELHCAKYRDSSCKKKKFNVKAIGRLAKKYGTRFTKIYNKIRRGIARTILELAYTVMLSPLILLDIVRGVLYDLFNILPKFIQVVVLFFVFPFTIFIGIFKKKDENGNKIKGVRSRWGQIESWGNLHPAFKPFMAFVGIFVVFILIMLSLKYFAKPVWKTITQTLEDGTLKNTKKRWENVMDTFPNKRDFDKLNPVYIVLGNRCYEAEEQCEAWMKKKREYDEYADRESANDELRSRVGVPDPIEEEEYSRNYLGILVIVCFMVATSYYIMKSDKKDSIILRKS
tara:strand:- start:1221 stop:2264 length:1044 start_codon:yes stop_codon:yes gene_type:complete